MNHSESHPEFDMKEFERQLKREKLLNTREIEFTGTEFDFATSAKSKGGTFLFPKLGAVMIELSEISAFLYRAAVDEAFRAAVMRHPLQNVETSGEVFGGGAWDLKHSQLMALLSRGHFDSGKIVGVGEQNEQHILKTVAYLTLKGVTKDWELENIYPFLSYARFKPLQAKVYAEVEKSLPRNSRRLLKVIEAMTRPQREALYAFHLNNTEDLTRTQVAANLGISADSLQDRIDAAMKRIQAEFKEMTASKKNRPKYWAGLFKLPDTRSQGVFKRSEAVKVRPLFQIDSATGIKTALSIREGRVRGTPIPGIRERKRRLRLTSYRPRHNGVESRKYAHMTNAYAGMAKSDIKDSGRTYVDFSSGDPKHVYVEHRRESAEDQIRKRNDKLFPGLRKNLPSKNSTSVQVSAVCGFDNLASLASHSK